MNLQDVKDLLQEFNGSELREFDLRKGDFELYLSKNESYGRPPALSGAGYGLPVVPEVAPATPVFEPPVATPTPEPVPTPEVAPAPVAVSGEVVTSPIVGNVYLQPAPDQPLFVKVGDVVKAEDTICIVEAMKMMNEVPAGISGTVTEIIATNEQVVGIGDELIRIQPN